MKNREKIETYHKKIDTSKFLKSIKKYTDFEILQDQCNINKCLRNYSRKTGREWKTGSGNIFYFLGDIERNRVLRAEGNSRKNALKKGIIIL